MTLVTLVTLALVARQETPAQRTRAPPETAAALPRTPVATLAGMLVATLAMMSERPRAAEDETSETLFRRLLLLLEL